MRERVTQLIGPAAETMPWLGTFHSIAAKMLRRHAELAGLEPNFTIIGPDDQLRLLKQLIQAEGSTTNAGRRASSPMRSTAGRTAASAPKTSTPPTAKASPAGAGQHCYRLYQARLKALNACDFGDLMLHMLAVLRKHREVLESWQQRFKYIMVDEYQDTNQVQYLWLRLLARRRSGNICVVGDDDQSIYSWRGAEVANILRFERDFPGAKVVRLEQNYRSTPQILAAASGADRQFATPRQDLVDRGTRRRKGPRDRVWDAPEGRVGEGDRTARA